MEVFLLVDVECILEVASDLSEIDCESVDIVNVSDFGCNLLVDTGSSL